VRPMPGQQERATVAVEFHCETRARHGRLGLAPNVALDRLMSSQRGFARRNPALSRDRIGGLRCANPPYSLHPLAFASPRDFSERRAD
jgi:hypothetical protein